MKSYNDRNIRVLGIAASTRGFGFAVMDEKALIDWGVKVVNGGSKNARCLSNVANLIARYEPDAIALEDPKTSRRGSRVKALIRKIVALAKKEKIKVKQFAGKEVSLGLLKRENGTKRALAKHVAARYPEELGFRLPQRKRRDYDSEDYRMYIFEAVGLAQNCLQNVTIMKPISNDLPSTGRQSD